MSNSRPNILILMTDQQRWDAVGCNGSGQIKTPHLDRMAGDGVTFDRFFVQNPVCMPSRVSMLTSQYCSRLNIFRNGIPVAADAVTLPRLLRNYGYCSANIGKLHFQNHASRDHRDIHPAYGFDHLEISDEPGCYEDAYRAWVRKTAPDQLDYLSLGLPPATEVWQKMLQIRDGISHPAERCPTRAQAFRGRSDVTHTAFVADRAIEYIRQRRSEPFLCIAGFYSPHSPWVAPQEFLDLYDPAALTIPTYPDALETRRRRDGTYSDDELRDVRRGYYAMVSEVDHHVGRILAALDDFGLADNTICVFTSDHGEWLGEHLRYGKGMPAHDCISRVPFIWRWPAGIAQPGRTQSGLAEGVDLVPTLLEAAGIPLPGHLQGQSILPALQGEAFPGRESALTEGLAAKTIRTAQFRYVADAKGEEMLFDLDADPAAYRNVAEDAAYAPALADMRRTMLTHLMQAERQLPRQWAY